MELHALTDQELDQLRIEILTERERRVNLERIPEQIRDLATTYRDGGGDEEALEGAISSD